MKDDGIRRIARVAGWEQGTRLLHLGCGLGWPSMFLAETIGAHVTAVDSDETSLDALRALVKSRSLTDSIDVKKIADLASPGFSAGEFEGILVDSRLSLPLEKALATFRKLLQQKGRLAMLYPVKVGRFPNAAVVGSGRRRSASRCALRVTCCRRWRSPATNRRRWSRWRIRSWAVLQSHRALGGAAVGSRPRGALKKELELHKSQAGKASVSIALVIGRRKEPGESRPRAAPKADPSVPLTGAAMRGDISAPANALS